jgi:hypothetical protein
VDRGHRLPTPQRPDPADDAKAWTTHHPNAQIRWTNNRVSDHADAPVNHQAKRSLRRGRITPPRGRDVVSDRCAAERATMGRPAKP